MLENEDSAYDALQPHLLGEEHQTTPPNSDASEGNIDLPERTFEVALFTSLNNVYGTRDRLTWEQFKKKLTTFTQRSSKDGPLISPAIYRDGLVHRRNQNVIALSALFGDCDESITFEELDAIISKTGLRAIVYPTHSHGVPDTRNHPNAQAPGQRYRVVFPLETPIVATESYEVSGRLNILFDGKLDAACKDPSRAYYLPAHPDPVGLPYKVYEGRLLSLDDLPELPAHPHVSSNVRSPVSSPKQGEDQRDTPWADFNAQSTNETVAAFLEKHGWFVERSDSPKWHATRPGKNGVGGSATIGHGAPGRFYVFSSNAEPFKERRSYSPFDVFLLLEHGGDVKAATKDLAKRGFGKASVTNVKDIPEPAIRPKEGKAVYEDSQLVKLLKPHWEVASLSSHAGHARRLCDEMEGELLYGSQLKWLIYNGRHWERDDKDFTQTAHRVRVLSRIVQEEAAALCKLASALALHDRVDDSGAMCRAAIAHNRHAKQVETKAFVKDTLHFAAGSPQLRVTADIFDQKPWLLGFENCVWDAGVLREHRSDDFLLNLCPVVLEPDVEQSEWLRVLHCISGDDEAFERTLQEVAGYILSGASDLRLLLWLYGPKATGKSSFAELLQTILGKMAHSVDPQKLHSNSARGRLGADLWNRRLAICAEAGNQKLDAELLKTLSGSDALTVEFKFHEAFNALPCHVLLMVSNDAPDMNAYDEALQDRVIALPFKHRLDAKGPIELTGGARIESIRKDPKSPLVKGFTAWAVEGLGRVHKNRSIFRAPCVENATKKFWEDTDPLTPFWETIEEAKLRAGIATSELRGDYETWCQCEGVKPLLGKNFGNACKSRGLQQAFRGPAKSRQRVWALPKSSRHNASAHSDSPESHIDASERDILINESHTENQDSERYIFKADDLEKFLV